MRSILRRIKMSLYIPIFSILYTHTLLELDYSISTYFSIIQLVLQHVGYMGYRDTGCIRSIGYMGIQGYRVYREYWIQGDTGIQGVWGVLDTRGYRDTGCIRSIGYMGIQGYRVYQEYWIQGDTGIQGVWGVLDTWGYRDTGCIRSIGYTSIWNVLCCPGLPVVRENSSNTDRFRIFALPCKLLQKSWDQLVQPFIGYKQTNRQTSRHKLF